MKLKTAAAVLMFCGITASANAQPLPAINLGQLVTPVVNLLNLGQGALTPLLQPVLSISGPFAGQMVEGFIPYLYPVIGPFGTVLAALPGLPQ